MRKTTPAFLFLLLTIFVFQPAHAQSPAGDDELSYKQEMNLLRAAIQKNFLDEKSGHFLNVVDPAKRENKDGYLREYTFIWSLCSLFQAANEVEKVDSDAMLLDTLIEKMTAYYDPAPPVPGYSDYIMNLKPGERYYDDNQWIGITALDAYERTGKDAYFQLGKDMYEFMMTGYDDVVGGGIYWKETSKETKNTCSNGPGILVALQMYRATQNQKYLDTAMKIYDWTNTTLQTPSKLYFDNIETKDKKINEWIFSYNTGTMMQSNLHLYEITGDEKYLTEAKAIAEASLPYFYGRDQFRDDFWFNAVLLRAYQHLLKHDGDLKYIRGFQKCLDNTLARDKSEQGLFLARDGVRNLCEHGGMLEILARFAFLEEKYSL